MTGACDVTSDRLLRAYGFVFLFLKDKWHDFLFFTKLCEILPKCCKNNYVFTFMWLTIRHHLELLAISPTWMFVLVCYSRLCNANFVSISIGWLRNRRLVHVTSRVVQPRYRKLEVPNGVLCSAWVQQQMNQRQWTELFLVSKGRPAEKSLDPHNF
jgi:hypothetical protein